MVLYLKYRPQQFKEVIGQDHVTTTLQNALKSGQLGHAYLFSGPRGTGKTSVARILAKVVNCDQPRGSEPCGKCSTCLAVAKGTFLDLVEIDAASNRGIDDVRALRGQVNFQPMQGKYKVYVLDEVHMLTKEAFNALLKTLEEPPAHVIFVLCTTEAHRLPSTVISRCQRFDFHLADEKALVEYLDSVSYKEGLTIDRDALALIARQAQGSFRDALGLLEQVSVFAAGPIARDKVIEVLGLTPESEAQKLLDFIAAGEVRKAIFLIDRLAQEGRDLYYFNSCLLALVREKLQVLLSGEGEINFSPAGLIQLIDFLQKASQGIKSATIPQLPLELAILKFCRPLDEERLSNKTTQTVAPVDASKSQALGGSTVSGVSTSDNPGLDLETIWQRVMREIKPYNHSVHALLKGCQLEKCEKGMVYLAFSYKFHKERIEAEKNRHLVEEVFSKVLGENVQMICLLREGAGSSKEAVAREPLASAESEVLSEDDLIRIAQEILGGEVREV